MRRPAGGVGDRMIEVALDRRPIATGPAAGQVPAAHKVLQRLGRDITRFGSGVGRMDQWHQPGRLSQFGNHFRCDEAVRPQLRCGHRAGAVDGGLLGDHMNDDRRGRATLARGTVGPAAPAGQPVGRRRQRPQRIRAALLDAARVVLTHRVGQRIQALFQNSRVGRQTRAVDFGDAVANVTDPYLATGLAFLAAPHRILVGSHDDLVDLRGQAPMRHRRPPRHVHGQLRVDAGQYLVIGQQIGAIDDGLKRPVVDVAGLENLRDPGQPLPHRAGVAKAARCQPLTDSQGPPRPRPSRPPWCPPPSLRCLSNALTGRRTSHP
ncbi:hypothetical protein MYSI104531_06535 [Mycobacterium simiae]